MDLEIGEGRGHWGLSGSRKIGIVFAGKEFVPG